MTYKVLTVDDNEAHCYALTRSLGAAGFSVLAAYTGAEALKIAMRERPDLVLLDIHLPDVSGIEVCRRLKADPQTSAIPVVFHSGTADASASQATREAGAAAFLTYPIEPIHLFSVIRGCLARATVAAAGHAG